MLRYIITHLVGIPLCLLGFISSSAPQLLSCSGRGKPIRSRQLFDPD